jgi:hypothetical protein
MEAGSKAEQLDQVKQSMEQWRREGWNVLSLSAPENQGDGKIRWSAELERTVGVNGDGRGYDDRRVAMIKRGQTSEAQLVEWFGPPDMRDVSPDGRAQLSWSFAPHPDSRMGNSGVLNVKLSSAGKVVAYTARRGQR